MLDVEGAVLSRDTELGRWLRERMDMSSDSWRSSHPSASMPLRDSMQLYRTSKMLLLARNQEGVAVFGEGPWRIAGFRARRALSVRNTLPQSNLTTIS